MAGVKNKPHKCDLFNASHIIADTGKLIAADMKLWMNWAFPLADLQELRLSWVIDI